MENYKTLVKEFLEQEEASKEFSIKLSEEEESEIEEFSEKCFEKFGKYPSESELKTLRMYYLGKKLTENR